MHDVTQSEELSVIIRKTLTLFKKSSSNASMFSSRANRLSSDETMMPINSFLISGCVFFFVGFDECMITMSIEMPLLCLAGVR